MPASPPPRCHVAGCGQPVAAQWQRHATQAEYDAIPEKLKPIDGIATIAVFGCDDHELVIDCDHQPAAPGSCPRCETSGDQPCTRDDGTPLGRRHTGRPALPVVACRHVHREDCGGHGNCQCTPDDPAPTRTPRTPPPSVDRDAVLRRQATIATAERAYIADLLAKYGGDKKLVAAEARRNLLSRIPPPEATR